MEKRAELGCGLSYKQFMMVVHEVLIKIKSANPKRVTGFEKVGQRPSKLYLYRLTSRLGIDLRYRNINHKNIYWATKAISHTRAMVSPQDVKTWRHNVEKHVMTKPGVMDCFSDPNRIYNQVSTI